MKPMEKSLIKWCNIACVAIMLLLILMQFMPYWYNFGGTYMSGEEFVASQVEAVAQEKEYVNNIRANADAIKEKAEALMPTEATEPAETVETVEETTEATEPAETIDPAQTLGEIQTLSGESKVAAGKISEVAAASSGEKLEVVSIAKTVWFPDDVEPPLLGLHLLILVFGALGVFFCLKNLNGAINCVFPLLVSIGGLGYWTNPAAQTGMLWVLHGIFALLLIPVTLVFVYLFIRYLIVCVKEA